jgi:CubicO group peptidase (beta-lactamase class C family)
MDQSSGLSTSVGEAGFGRRPTSLLGQVRALRDTTVGRPGTFRYSNANYEVLGALVERVSGLPYGTYLHRHVLRPLGMTHTYTTLAAARAGGLLAGHRIWFGLAVPDGIYYRPDFLPAGFLVSTAGDMNRYASAMLHGGRYGGHRVLSDAGVHTLLAPSIDASTPGRTRSYAMGWYVERINGHNLVYAPGSAHNTHTTLVLDPEHHTAVTVLADAESTLYYAIPKFDLVAMNATVLAAGGRAQGTIRGLYVVFDLLVALAGFFYVRALRRVLRNRAPGLDRLSRLGRGRLAWREVLSPVLILTVLPRRLGFSWLVLIRSDVGAAAAGIALLGLTTAGLRIAWWIRSHRTAAA